MKNGPREQQVRELKASGFYQDWKTILIEKIIFHLHPRTILPEGWTELRNQQYKINAEKLQIVPQQIDFYVYPSKEMEEELGFIPAFTLGQYQEIHGHPNQSPGHELTHALLWRINEKMPKFWGEGTCVYLDGNSTDKRAMAKSLNYSDEVLQTPWLTWLNNLPDNRIMYTLAGSVIQYLTEHYGWDKVLKFLQKVDKDPETTSLFIQHIFNISQKEFQTGWQRWFGEKYPSIMT